MPVGLAASCSAPASLGAARRDSLGWVQSSTRKSEVPEEGGLPWAGNLAFRGLEVALLCSRAGIPGVLNTPISGVRGQGSGEGVAFPLDSGSAFKWGCGELSLRSLA